MAHHLFTRREFMKSGTAAALLTAAGWPFPPSRPPVSIVRIENGRIEYAVEKAIDLLGGIRTVTRGKQRIMLKPNLVAESPDYTTKPPVIRALARLMKDAGKEVLIGEGSAAAGGFNFRDNVTYRTRKPEVLNPMQQYVFDQLGYSELAESLNIPLLNLHSGDLTEVALPGGFLTDKIVLHHSLTEIDLLCSVPMMKTHVLATVTLGMKNLIGLYPGTEYYSVRSWLHDRAAEKHSPGVAFEILDMVRAVRPGLTVIDGSTAMEGDGPTGGRLVKMDLIIAGINPLATDMVAAAVMGFAPEEIPTFSQAMRLGMGPSRLADIDIRGASVDSVKRQFMRPNVIPWSDISKVWGVKEI